MKVSFIFILLLAVSLSGCKTISNNFEFNENQSKIDINSKRYPITIFEGNVMELYSKEAIPLATVTLRGEDGINRGALTDSTGFFLIKDIKILNNHN